MALFNFFKKNPIENNSFDKPDVGSVIDENLSLPEVFKSRLIKLGFEVKRHPQYLAIVVNDELEIATLIIKNPDSHPNLLHLMVVATHPIYFPAGIEENLAGFGSSPEGRINSALDNYINTTFLTIIDGFSDNHNPGLDFSTLVNGKEILWHPKLGRLHIQGQWDEQPEEDAFFNLLKGQLLRKLGTNKINWLKIYISKRADSTIIGECLFNNESWEEGLREIYKFAEHWKVKGEFQGLKQFTVFRRCDASD